MISAPEAARKDPVVTGSDRIARGSAPGRSRRVLLIAYHYPPCQESSGYLRALAFSRYLPEFGWAPLVLTASTRAYSRTDPRQCARIPESVPVVRAFARDAREHFSIRYKYPSLLAAPDRWSSWWFGAVPAGLSLIRRYRPDLIWATQPNPTAFWVAHTLHRLTGTPWVADFRDPVAGPGDNRWAQRACRWVERKTIEGCSRAIFTAPGAARQHAERYPAIPANRWAIIPNGYDESDFEGLGSSTQPHENRPLRLIHSGALYPGGRDPSALFAAIARLKSANALSGADVNIVLRGTDHDDFHLQLIDRYNISDIVQLAPAVPHKEALAEICRADGLLVFQGRMHNGQIPAKIYEYLRARKPIFALTDEAGDTGGLLRDAGIDTIVPIDNSGAITGAFEAFVQKVRSGDAPVAPPAVVAAHSREARARQLSEVFDEVLTTRI
ncbi:MAG TPA: glycosyltransferase [Gammaproteobacteria bacterium]|nr:glycosyltransferase [Gammaproteobacteria bacterium]